MALQDLTPQLRTRLSRVERMVGFFVSVAAILLVFGFCYYLYHTAQRKGWFLTKAPYFTYLHSAAGLKVGDNVKLMGFDVGAISRITAEEPGKAFDVYIEFVIKSPFYGYLWTDSKAKAVTGDFLGNRYLEVTKGIEGRATYKEESRKFLKLWKRNILVGIWDEGNYKPITESTKPYWLLSDDSPALNERLDEILTKVETALPSILVLTNQLASVLTNGSIVANNLNLLIANGRPAVSNLVTITEQLRDPHGSFGEWLIPTNINLQLQETLTNAGFTLNSVNTNLAVLVENLSRSLDNLASMTSNLNSQVQANTNMLGAISDAVIHSDELVQGLKRHWLLRSAFRSKTNQPPLRPIPARGANR
jgi:ABC-type transporter Mla subunit MlaD